MGMVFTERRQLVNGDWEIWTDTRDCITEVLYRGILVWQGDDLYEARAYVERVQGFLDLTRQVAPVVAPDSPVEVASPPEAPYTETASDSPPEATSTAPVVAATLPAIDKTVRGRRVAGQPKGRAPTATCRHCAAKNHPRLKWCKGCGRAHWRTKDAPKPKPDILDITQYGIAS